MASFSSRYHILLTFAWHVLKVVVATGDVVTDLWNGCSLVATTGFKDIGKYFGILVLLLVWAPGVGWYFESKRETATDVVIAGYQIIVFPFLMIYSGIISIITRDGRDKLEAKNRFEVMKRLEVILESSFQQILNTGLILFGINVGVMAYVSLFFSTVSFLGGLFSATAAHVKRQKFIKIKMVGKVLITLLITRAFPFFIVSFWMEDFRRMTFFGYLVTSIIMFELINESIYLLSKGRQRISSTQQISRIISAYELTKNDDVSNPMEITEQSSESPGKTKGLQQSQQVSIKAAKDDENSVEFNDEPLLEDQTDSANSVEACDNENLGATNVQGQSIKTEDRFNLKETLTNKGQSVKAIGHPNEVMKDDDILMLKRRKTWLWVCLPTFVDLNHSSLNMVIFSVTKLAPNLLFILHWAFMVRDELDISRLREELQEDQDDLASFAKKVLLTTAHFIFLVEQGLLVLLLFTYPLKQDWFYREQTDEDVADDSGEQNDDDHADKGDQGGDVCLDTLVEEHEKPGDNDNADKMDVL